MGAKIDYKNAINTNLNVIYLNNIPFYGIDRESLLGWEELVWSKTPNRTKGTFAFSNIDSIDVGLVARCELSFKYCNIEDFKRLNAILKNRTFMVKFFNVDTGEWVTREMYCSENQKGKLYYYEKKLLGIFDLSIKMVGTNRDLWFDLEGNPTYGNDLTISYNANGGTGVEPTTIATWGDEVITGNGMSLSNSGYHIKEWNTKANGSGWSYGLNQKITLWQDLTLYAIWERA